MISAGLARRHFPDRDPLGRRLLIDDNNRGPRPVIIVGIVGDVKQLALDAAPTPDIYIPLPQIDESGIQWLRNNSFWVLRTKGDPAGLAESVRREIRAVDPSVPATNVKTLDEIRTLALAVRRFSALVVGLFAGAALFLSAAGLYAVIAQGVILRSREMGVRLALGATRSGIAGLVVGEGLRLVAAGCALGMAAALLLAGTIQAQLYATDAHDPLTLAAVAAVLVFTGFLACLLPALRAGRTDPIQALRAE